jgi:hypothetical protein
MTAVVLGAIVVLAALVLGVLRGRRNREEPALLRFQAWQLVLAVLLLAVLAAHSRLGLTLPSVNAHDLALPHLKLPHVTLPHAKVGGMVVKAGLVAFALLLALVALLRRRRTAAV